MPTPVPPTPLERLLEEALQLAANPRAADSAVPRLQLPLNAVALWETEGITGTVTASAFLDLARGSGRPGSISPLQARMK